MELSGTKKEYTWTVDEEDDDDLISERTLELRQVSCLEVVPGQSYPHGSFLAGLSGSQCQGGREKCDHCQDRGH